LAAPVCCPRRNAFFQHLLAASLALAVYSVASVDSALALMGHQTSVPANAFGTRSLAAPTALTGSAQGHGVSLSWSSGQNGTAYAVNGAANGASNDCGAASFANLDVAPATAYVEGERFSPQGGWYCYQVVTTANTWQSQADNPVVAVQLGFVAASVAFTSGSDTSGCGIEQTGVASELDCGDQVVITFNQPVNTSTGPAETDSVCADSSGDALWLGSAVTSGACSPAEPVSIGSLSGSGVDGCDCRFDASYAWDTAGQALTVTLGARTAGDSYPELASGPWTFKPTTDTARLQSSTGAFHVCDTNSGGNDCWPAIP